METVPETGPTQAQIEAAAEVNTISDDWDGTNEHNRKIAEIHAAKIATIERCVQELARLRQHEFGEADQFAIGFNEAIKQAQFRLSAMKDKP